MRVVRLGVAAIAMVAALSVAATASATTVNLITNGDFSSVTNTYGSTGTGQLASCGQSTCAAGYIGITGWYANAAQSASYNNYPFLFIDNQAAENSTGFYDEKDGGFRSLWDAANSNASTPGGYNTWNGAGPGNSTGNYLVADGAYNPTAIQQNVAGLTVGTTYLLTFQWAAAQWSQQTGATTESFTVGLGDQSQSTITYQDPSHGFSGWMTDTMSFTYDGSSNILSFLAVGSPSGEPPNLLLDDVTMYAQTTVPEPSGWGIFIAGCAIAYMVRRRSASQA